MLDVALARAFSNPCSHPPRLFLIHLAPSLFCRSRTCICQLHAESCLSACQKRCITPSSCRSQRNETTTPTSVFNAFIANLFSKRQPCGRTVVSTAKECLCILAADQSFHAISFMFGMGFFQLSRKSMIFDHHCFLKQSEMMNSGNPTHVFLHAHSKTLVSLLQQTVPTATLLSKPKHFWNQTKSVTPC